MYVKVIEIEQNFHFFIFSSPSKIMFCLPGKGKTVIVGTTTFLRKHSKNMAFKGD